MAQTQDWYCRKHDECETALVDALTTIRAAPISPFIRQKKIKILNFEKSNVSENKSSIRLKVVEIVLVINSIHGNIK